MIEGSTRARRRRKAQARRSHRIFARLVCVRRAAQAQSFQVEAVNISLDGLGHAELDIQDFNAVGHQHPRRIQTEARPPGEQLTAQTPTTQRDRCSPCPGPGPDNGATEAPRASAGVAAPVQVGVSGDGSPVRVSVPLRGVAFAVARRRR